MSVKDYLNGIKNTDELLNMRFDTYEEIKRNIWVY